MPRHSRSSSSRSRESKSGSRSPSEDVEGTRVHVGELPASCTERDLEHAFKKYGPLVEVWMAKVPPCFAFIVFRDREDAEEAIRGMNGRTICGRRVRVSIARPRVEARGPRRASYNGDMRCYQCGDRGHLSRNCYVSRSRRTRSPRRRQHSSSSERSSSRSRTRSRSHDRKSKKKDKSREKSHEKDSGKEESSRKHSHRKSSKQSSTKRHRERDDGTNNVKEKDEEVKDDKEKDKEATEKRKEKQKSSSSSSKNDGRESKSDGRELHKSTLNSEMITAAGDGGNVSS